MKLFLLALAVTCVSGHGEIVNNVYCSGADHHTDHDKHYEFSVQHGKAIVADSKLHTKIPFDVIKVNEDNVYIVTNSEFKAPVPGVYSFQYSAASKFGNLAVYLHSSKQSWLVSAVAATANSQAYNSIIVELTAGELISVKLGPSTAARSCNPPCSTFSGRLLRETHKHGGK